MTVKFENLDRNEDVVTSWKEDVVTAFSVLEHLSGPRLRWEPLCSSSADTERDIPRQAAPPVKYDCLVSTSDNLKFNFSINSKLFSAGRERERAWISSACCWLRGVMSTAVAPDCSIVFPVSRVPFSRGTTHQQSLQCSPLPPGLAQCSNSFYLSI